MENIKKDTDKGKEIRDKVFNGNPYAQLAAMMKDSWANDVILDKIRYDADPAVYSQVDESLVSGYERIYTDEDLVKAEQIKTVARGLYSKINELKEEE